MMNTKCVHCGKIMQVDFGLQGAQMNCPHCHRVFVVEPIQANATEMLPKLILVADPLVRESSIGHYEALADLEITPESTMRTIHDAFPDTDAEKVASDELGRVATRLAVDLMLYPLWQRED